MLTPEDIQNKTFKGGIGFDKKDVEVFVQILANDYERLYRSNIELKDKVSALNESLQHYRAMESSLQKAMTLSEKTAEETVNAAQEKATQITTEAKIQAEAILADSKEELQQLKDDIYHFTQQFATFKKQYQNILQAQLHSLDGEVIDIDLGADYEKPSERDNEQPGYSGSGLSEGGLGGGYVGNRDNFERTNQDPAFDRGSLNMDPFSSAANGGGRFSKHTVSAHKDSNNKKKGMKKESESSISIAGSKPKYTNTTYTKTAEAAPVSEPIPNASQTEPTPLTDSTVKQEASTTTSVTPSQEAVIPQTTDKPKRDVKAKKLSDEDQHNDQNFGFQNFATTESLGFHDTRTSGGFGDANTDSLNGFGDAKEQSVTWNQNPQPVHETTGFQASDDSTTKRQTTQTDSFSFDHLTDDSGFASSDNTTDDSGFASSENLADPSNKTPTGDSGLYFDENPTESASFSFSSHNTFEEDAYHGEVEDRIHESTMLDSEDNYADGFDIMDEDDSDSPALSFESDSSLSPSSDSRDVLQQTDDDTYIGEVEDRVNESTMLDSEDNYSDGFDFVIGNESEENDIPTILNANA